MKPEETIDFHIRWAWAKMSKAYNVQAAKVNATMPMAYTLLSIDKDGTPATKLGPKMGMEPTSLSRLLKTMEEQGYISRKKDDIDGRKVYIHITDKGHAYREIAKQRVVEFNEHMQRTIDPEKLAVFFDVMKTINHELDKNKIFG
jgi:MarR family transcriptional regulator, organic hydroperoxide resistance regulator